VLTLVPVWRCSACPGICSADTPTDLLRHAAFFASRYAVALARSTSICPMDPDSGRRDARRTSRTADRLPTFRLQDITSHWRCSLPLAILYVFEWLGFQEITLRSSATIRLPICNSATPHLYAAGTGDDAGTILLTLRIESSRFGMRCVRSSRMRPPRKPGINTLAWKLRAIVLSGRSPERSADSMPWCCCVTPQSYSACCVGAGADGRHVRGVERSGPGDRIRDPDPLAETSMPRRVLYLPGIQE